MTTGCPLCEQAYDGNGSISVTLDRGSVTPPNGQGRAKPGIANP